MKTDIKATFGSRVQQLRKDMQVSQEDFANTAGIARSYISKLERGLANPSIEAVAQLADSLGIAVADLFTEGKASRRQPQADLVPFAADGSHFDKKLCKHPDGVYKVGNKDDDVTFAKYDDALRYLRCMGQAQWMRPNVSGKWGYVTAVSWKAKRVA